MEDKATLLDGERLQVRNHGGQARVLRNALPRRLSTNWLGRVMIAVGRDRTGASTGGATGAKKGLTY